MAFVIQNPLDQTNQAATAGAGTTPASAQAPITTSSAPGAGPSGGSGGKTASVAPTTAGQPFSNLSAYLTANQPQIANQANLTAGELTNQYGQLQQEIGNAANAYTSAVGAQYAPYATDLSGSVAANPAAFVQNPSNVTAFQEQVAAPVATPTFETISPYTTANADVTNAAGTAANVNTLPGLQTYLTQQAQNTNTPYTTGESVLDATLLNQSPAAIQQVQDAAAPIVALPTALANTVTAQDAAAQAAYQAALQQQQTTTSGLTADEQALINAIGTPESATGVAGTGELGTAQAAAQAQNAAVLADLASKNLSPTDLATLGITPDQWAALQSAVTAAGTPQTVQSANGQFGAQSGTANIDLTQWLQQLSPQAQITAANVATPSQYANAAALAELAGTGGWSTNPLNPANAAEAGTAPTNLNTFGYAPALSTSQGTGKAEVDAANAYVAALQAGADQAHAQLAAQNATKNADIAAASSIVIPVSVAAASGLKGAAQNYASNITSSDPKQIAANVASMGLIPAGQAVVAGVESAVQSITSIFCFDGFTRVEMADGTETAIKDIKLGDSTKGGMVLAVIKAVSPDLYTYQGVEVSGKHAVKEDGQWVRVENSDHKGFKHEGIFEVHCLVTSQHRIWVRGIEFADYVETDHYEDLTLAESLEALNGNHVG